MKITDKLYEELKDGIIGNFGVLVSIAELYDDNDNTKEMFVMGCINFSDVKKAREEIKSLMDFEGFKFFLNDETGKERFKTKEDVKDFINASTCTPPEIYEDIIFTNKRFYEELKQEA